jgi:hypothetical protein
MPSEWARHQFDPLPGPVTPRGIGIVAGAKVDCRVWGCRNQAAIALGFGMSPGGLCAAAAVTSG